MSDLHRFDPASDDDVRREFDAFEERCVKILSVVFKRTKLEIAKFPRWLCGVAPDNDAKAHFVHNDPFEISADFVGMPQDSAEYKVAQHEFRRLAHRLKWDRSPS